MNSAVTAVAIDAVGAETSEDWQLRPELHASELKAAAGPLKRVLMRERLEQIIDAFNSADREALAAQARYKLLSKAGAIASFASVSLAGISLLTVLGSVPSALLTGIAAVQGLLVITSFTCSLLLGQGRYFEVWMRQRAEAENARINLFRRVLSAEEPNRPNELPLLPLKLEYFRRYQLDMQRRYYTGRGAQHAAAVRRRWWWRVAALTLIVIAGMPLLWMFHGGDVLPNLLGNILTIVPPKTELTQRIFLCLGLTGGALQGLLASYALLNHDERNAARYQDTARNLDDLASRPLDEARAAAAAGDSERVFAFAALVNEQISSEHREWIALRSVVPDLSLDRLRHFALPKIT
jgi:hypothetical protein